MKVVATGGSEVVARSVPKRPPPQSEPKDELLSNSDHVPAKLAAALEAAGKPYYDEARDRKELTRYYGGVDLGADGSALYRQLSTLVRRTHTTRFGFDPSSACTPGWTCAPTSGCKASTVPNPWPSTRR